ncbi:coiled-coil domain-containing protein 146-like [Huso huso]|uniref:Coiled-coil domain-containing protein 146-like n=1 Tax=Huso huso TaxID=61971 RepID=A0ABR0ZT83_HUSHU
MSTNDESSHRSDDEEESQEKPISAIAPQVNLQEEVPADVSASPAFQCLDELFSIGKIRGTRVAELKASYTLLHETLKSTQQSEIQMLQDAKHFTAQIERQKQELERADHFPEGFDTEVSKMRQQLLKLQNDLNEAEEIDYNLQYKLESLHEEKKILEREYGKMPKPGELEKKTKALKDNCEELRKEIAQRKLEIEALKEDMEVKQRQIQREQKELDERKDTQEDLKAELVRLQLITVQLGKEIERINRKNMDVQKKKTELEELTSELSIAQKQTETKFRMIGDEKQEVMKELDGKRALLEAQERELNKLMKELETGKENEVLVMGERAILDLNLRHLLMEKKTLHDSVSRKQREKDRDLRNLKKMELQLKLANDALVHIQSLHEKEKSQMDAFPKDDGTQLERRKELQKEVEMIKQNLAQQQSLTEVEARMVEQCIAEEHNLVEELNRYREEVFQLTRLVQIKTDEREQKSRDFVKAEQRVNRTKQEVKAKSLVIQEHKKKYQEIKARLHIFANIYDIIKNERNKCVNLIQTASQKAAEMREKSKILENEIEILMTAAFKKESLLQKSKMKHLNSQTVRDSIRSDISKVSDTLYDLRDKREEQKMHIGKLSTMISQAEEKMVQLQKMYETAVQNRNDRGVQLIEREEEVCIFFEKVNIQDTLIQNGNLEVQAIEEEIRFLKLLIAEEERQNEQIRKSLPHRRALEADLVVLQIQFSQCRDRTLELEKKVADPCKENRMRLLEGKDPSHTELITKAEELEVRLGEKEELLLEKDLIYEQVTRLSQRVRTKAENGKQDTLALAKNVNELQNKIKETTRKMMALVSELSMQQANAMKMQQEVQEKEQFLESCHMRLEQGLPPSPEMELEWLRTVRDQQRRNKENEEKARIMEEDQQYQLANGVYTTSEPRPNAYIPQEEDALPLARPYGALAPFKPTEPGGNIRHIRKPVIKPIEI